jgi:NAD(P)H-hydrate epimerase
MILKNSPDLWIDQFPFPGDADHKYSRGLVLINSGPVFKTGAARLAGRAAMRVGAGAVKLICDKESAQILEPQISVELIAVIQNKNEFQSMLKDKKISSVLIGPGNTISDETKARTLLALAFIDHVVIDADAITSFEGSPNELFIDTYEHTILTPHEGEFKRLFGDEINNIEDKVVRTVEGAKKAGSIVLLKGSDTVIAHPSGKVVINSSKAPYLATAGSGDVLAGIISSLVGHNKMNAFDAACAGSWIHSQLGELLGPGLIADDLVDNIPLIVKKLSKLKIQ